MNLLQVDSDLSLADCVAKLTIDKLNSAITEFDEAVWVLAGGSTPLACYEVIRNRYAESLDWQKVWFVLGDERHVAVEHVDSNRSAIEDKLLATLKTNPDRQLLPAYFENLEEMARAYKQSLSKLPKDINGQPRFDVVWLGVGEDGHTLSLFPGSDLSTLEVVVPVYDSPKPPAERITLSLSVLSQSRECLILATGEAKAKAVKGLISNDLSLPIAQSVQQIESNHGHVCLLVDKQASSLIDN